MRILIVNSVALNAGDAAILFGEIRALREAFGEDVTIEVAEQVPEVARRLYPGVAFVPGFHSRRAARPGGYRPPVLASIRWRRTWLAVRLLRWSRSLGQMLMSPEQRAHVARIAAADLVIATGGTYFVEHYNFSGKADELVAAAALGTPFFLYTQSMGPFRRSRNRSLMRRIVAAAQGVFLRDERSVSYLAETGARTDAVSVHPDAAFALADDRTRSQERAQAPRVAVSVRAWVHARRDADGGDAAAAYRRAITDAVRDLARAGIEVTFLSTCQGVPEYWTDDARYAQELVAESLVGEPRVHVDSRFHTPLELADELRRYDAAIATRMHLAILSLSVATPVVAIAYEFKSRELLRGLGLERLVTDFEDVRASWLVERVREVVEAAPLMRARIAEQLPSLKREATRPAFMVRERLASGER